VQGVFFETPCDIFNLGIYSYDIFGLGIDITYSCDIRNTVCFTFFLRYQCQACLAIGDRPGLDQDTQGGDFRAKSEDQNGMARTTFGEVDKQQQLLLVSRISGPYGPYKRDMQGKEGRTQGCGYQVKHHGRSRVGKGCGGAAKIIDHHLDQFALALDCIPALLTATTDETAILYSGCTSIFLSETSPGTSKQAAHIPLNVNMHYGKLIQSSYTCELLLADSPPK
jgi:hypothetical protein